MAAVEVMLCAFYSKSGRTAWGCRRFRVPSLHVFPAEEDCHHQMKKWRTWLDIAAKAGLIGRKGRAESRLCPYPAELQAPS